MENLLLIITGALYYLIGKLIYKKAIKHVLPYEFIVWILSVFMPVILITFLKLIGIF